MDSDLARVLEPDSVAIIGASRTESKRGHRVIKNLQANEYEGSIYLINPKYEDEQIRGLNVYSDISSIPDRVDLAFIVTPARTIPAILESCGEAGVAGALVTAAGFGEIGRDDLRNEMLEIARRYGLRVIGPNMLGFVNTSIKLDMGAGYPFPPGHIALLSQSGNFGAACSLKLDRTEGFSFFISVGNEDDIKFHEYIDFLSGHEPTEAVMMYIEGMSEGRSFLQSARNATKEMPIVVLKGGRSNAGKHSAQSHTASLAGDVKIVEAGYKQSGVLMEEHIEEMLFTTETLRKMPPLNRGNVAIITEGGGHATRATDTISEHPNLNVSEFSDQTKDELEEILLTSPRAPSEVTNPIDRGAYGVGTSTISECARVVLEDDNIDALFLCGLLGGYSGVALGPGLEQVELEIVTDIASLIEKHNKPIVMQSEFAGTDSEALTILRDANIPMHTSMATAVNGLAALSEYGLHLDTVGKKSDFVLASRDEPSPLIGEALESGRSLLSEFETRTLLEKNDIPVTRYRLTQTPEEAVRAAEHYGYPVAMKISSPEIEHKTEAGGVALNLRSSEDVDATFQTLFDSASTYDPSADIEGVLVSPMVEDGPEFIIGVLKDSEVGHAIMFGLGGIFAEELEDVAFRVLPLTEHDAGGLIADIKAQGLLDGVRESIAVDRNALIEILMQISNLVSANPQIAQLDLNPVRVTNQGLLILDASARLEEV